jgi:bis(5'-nucleosyl)-tetraphosphatase (symmetrical)
MGIRRTICVGDIHGCLQEFDDLLAHVEFEKGKDRLVLVGDLLDRGPDSVGVVARAMELNADCVRGNHEWKHQKLRRNFGVVVSNRVDHLLINASENSKRIQTGLSAEQWDWLDRTPYKLRLSPTLVVVHAGLAPARSYEDQSPECLMRVRHVDVHGEFLGGAWFDRPPGGYYWAEGYRGPDNVIYGHQVHSLNTPRLNEQKAGGSAWMLGLDTGCCYGGRLSACVLTHEKGLLRPSLASVPARSEYSALYTDKSDAKKVRKAEKKANRARQYRNENASKWKKRR